MIYGDPAVVSVICRRVVLVLYSHSAIWPEFIADLISADTELTTRNKFEENT